MNTAKLTFDLTEPIIPVERELMSLVFKNHKVVVEWIGEGKNGDYDPNDKNDSPMLRFSCHQRNQQDTDWEEMSCSSYCTRLAYDAPFGKVSALAREVLLTVMCNPNYKSELERLSWWV